MAALITAVLVPIQLAVFVAYPFPDTVTGWFELPQDNPVAGLVDLDLLLVDNLLLVVIALTLYVALRQTSPSVTTMATGLWILAIAMFIASNPALEMLALDAFRSWAPMVELGEGGLERWIVYPIVLWLVAFGSYLMAAPATPSPQAGMPPV